MSNIEALHASAGEMTCDQTTDEECRIGIPTTPPVVRWSWGKRILSDQ